VIILTFALLDDLAVNLEISSTGSSTQPLSIRSSQVEMYWDICNNQFRQHHHRFVSSCGAYQRVPYLLGQPGGDGGGLSF
jgi:hypothetical protein